MVERGSVLGAASSYIARVLPLADRRTLISFRLIGRAEHKRWAQSKREGDKGREMTKYMNSRIFLL